MRIVRLLLILLAASLAAACTHNRWRADEATAYYQAQAATVQNEKPLFELKAQPGQTIELKGVEQLTVRDPRQIEIKPMPESPHPVWGLLGNVLNTGAKVYGFKVGADAAVDIVEAVGKSAGDHSVTTIDDSSQHYGDGAVLGNGNVIGNGNGDGARAGRDIVGGDRVDGNVGDNQGDTSGNSGRIDSPGPIDDNHSSNDSNNDNSSGDPGTGG